MRIQSVKNSLYNTSFNGTINSNRHLKKALEMSTTEELAKFSYISSVIQNAEDCKSFTLTDYSNGVHDDCKLILRIVDKYSLGNLPPEENIISTIGKNESKEKLYASALQKINELLILQYSNLFESMGKNLSVRDLLGLQVETTLKNMHK